MPHRQCRLISATLLQLFGRPHIKTVLSISHTCAGRFCRQRTTASTTRSRLLRASLPQCRRSSFPQTNTPASCTHHDMFTQFASLRDSLVLAVDYLWFSWRSMSCFASLHDRIRAGRSEPLSFSLAVTCACPRSCGSMSSAQIAPPCFTRLRFQLRLLSRDAQDFVKRVRPT